VASGGCPRNGKGAPGDWNWKISRF
jgi:hypothetical protein